MRFSQPIFLCSKVESLRFQWGMGGHCPPPSALVPSWWRCSWWHQWKPVFSTRFVLPPAQCLLVGSSDFCLFTHMDCNFCRINTGGEIAASLLTVIQTNNKKQSQSWLDFWTRGLRLQICLFLGAVLHAKLLQSCLTLCDLIDFSPPGSSVIGFSRQEYWSGLPCSPRDLPDPGIEPTSLYVSCIGRWVLYH